MKILSVTGESVPASKGGSPSDTFERSTVTYQVEGESRTLTVTYVRYFEKVLAEQGIYDQEQEGVPVNRITALLFIEKHPEATGSRHYFNDTDAFTALFEGFSLAEWKKNYADLTLV